ncbi:hypothetical protein [Hydrogenophaga crassostreae]|uniref:hypothetical protein n=1 Tax=Hydrogenophaga crassostreae TaxID=1763535 RepID=UPI000AE1F38C|nr:hypothetical protein [Hydrogenophaga crassostreae]
MKNRGFSRGRLLGVVASTLALTACAQLSSLTQSLDFFQSSAPPPKMLTLDIGREVGSLGFAFELDNKSDKDSDQVGSGYIVVLRDGKEVQALPHVFEMAPDRLDAQKWLEFSDFNGDGFLDFKAARLAPAEGQLPLDSVYQFDRKSSTFALVDDLSGVGEVSATTPGCVALKLQTADRASKQESLCFATASSKWVFSKPGSGRDQLARSQSAQQCDPLAPNLKACQLARIDVEGRLQTLMREYRSGKRKSLQMEKGKGYADAYAKNFDWDYLSWRRYRDARCAVQAREQALSVKDLPAATALCRYDWSRDQLRRYQEQVARLLDEK